MSNELLKLTHKIELDNLIFLISVIVVKMSECEAVIIVITHFEILADFEDNIKMYILHSRNVY